VECQPWRHRSDLEFPVEQPFRICDGCEGQSGLELQHEFPLGMKDDHFTDARRDDFGMALGDGAKV
jgi:hypothetical protein